MKIAWRNKLMITVVLFIGIQFPSKSQSPNFLKVNGKWADSVLKTFSDRDKIAQLFMVAAYSNKDQKHVDDIKKLVSEYHIGGLIFFQGGPVRQARLTNIYQKISPSPLFIAMDAEWGLSMRLDSTIRFPKQMTLGALPSDSLVYDMGNEIARQCKRLGVQISFSPVADINNNSLNPVINYRSFGENRELVTQRSLAYMKGLQDQKIIATAKHFPGHGDVETDSHLALPQINHSLSHLDSLEFYPFKKLIQSGLSAMMVAHLFIPVLEPTQNMATTLSNKVVTELLKTQMKFEGLIFTDALNMKGVSSFYKPGEVDVKALLAGNDVLLFPEDVPKAIQMIETAIKNGEITMAEIEKRCLKILKAKEWTGLNHLQEIDLNNLTEDLNTIKGRAVNRRLFAESITLLENEDEIVPLKELDTLKIAVLNIGDTLNNVFQKSIQRYAKTDIFQVSSQPKGKEWGNLLTDIHAYDLVIIGLYGNSAGVKTNYGISEEAIALINVLQSKHRVIVSLFANPYALNKMDGATLWDGLLVAYENTVEAKDYAGQIIFGGEKCRGKLPVTASKYYKYGDGIKMNKRVRLSYVLPEEIGVNSEDLKRVEELAVEQIQDSAFPGCQILAAKNGRVFYYQSFGYHTYDSVINVKNSDLYDLASVTKILSTVSATMYQNDKNQIHLDSTLGDYLPDVVDSSEYSKTVLRDMLSHQAKFQAWIPFYSSTMKEGIWSDLVYRTSPMEGYSKRVAENLYILDTYNDSILKRIRNAELLKKKKYLYSDMGYYFLQEIIERQTKTALNVFVDSIFYQPLGLQSLGYLPRKKFALEEIAPTEDDQIFRKQLIHGDVHDQGAAMLGGVAGHAGLFGNAHDVAVMMQMLMNYGQYGGERFLSEKVVKEFTACQFCETNRRGAGFDRPTFGDVGPTCECVSALSFGHTGFTGITTWADPESGVVYVFLSNRSYPIADNPKILKSGVRTKIQQAFYNALR
jgi:beta-N-acetylhexosaminidase